MAGLLQNKSIIVTGGSTGIGRASALRCAEEGAQLIIADVNVAAAEATCAEIEARGVPPASEERK